MSQKQIVKVLITLVILELLGAGVWYVSASPTPAIAPGLEIIPVKKPKAELSLQSAAATVVQDQEFTADVILTQEKAKLLGVDAVLTYDPEILTVEEVTLGSAFTESLPVQIKADEGKVYITLYNRQGQEITGEVKLATLKLRAKAAGEVALQFDFTPGATTDSNVSDFETKEDILDKAEGAIYTVN